MLIAQTGKKGEEGEEEEAWLILNEPVRQFRKKKGGEGRKGKQPRQ